MDEGCARIFACAREAKDATALPGPLKIKLAAGEHALPDDGAGVRKIIAAAGKFGKLDDGSAALKITEAANDDGEPDQLSKSLKALAGILAAIPASLFGPAGRHDSVRAQRRPVRVPGTVRAPMLPKPPSAAMPSTHPVAYWDFRDRLAGDIRRKAVHPSPEQIVQHAVTVYGANIADAAEWTEQLLAHLQRDRGATATAVRRGRQPIR